MSGHTPGPWRVEVCSNGILSVQHPAGYVVDDIDCGSDDPCSIHDAHLIAAAPDMLEALDSLVAAYLGSSDPIMQINAAVAAIRKARGAL